MMRFRSQNHPQQVARRGAALVVDDRTTPPELFDPLNARFGFTIDVAASARNARCPRFYSIDDNGLDQDWAGEVVWCNPPYSDIRPWVLKAWLESNVATIVMLLPANRTEQSWWQDLVEHDRDRPGSPLRVEFLPRRQRFIQAGRSAIGPNERPPFGVCLLIWS